eukprot:771341-Amphidinium_carterae.1
MYDSQNGPRTQGSPPLNLKRYTSIFLNDTVYLARQVVWDICVPNGSSSGWRTNVGVAEPRPQLHETITYEFSNIEQKLDTEECTPIPTPKFQSHPTRNDIEPSRSVSLMRFWAMCFLSPFRSGEQVKLHQVSNFLALDGNGNQAFAISNERDLKLIYFTLG